MFSKKRIALGGKLTCVALLLSATFAALHTHAEQHSHGTAAAEQEVHCSFCELASGNHVGLVVPFAAEEILASHTQELTLLVDEDRSKLITSSRLTRAPPV